MKRYIFTGTPSSGKTTLLHVLRSQRYSIIEEAATDVIAREQEHGNREPHTQTDFIDQIVALQKRRQIEAAARPDTVQLYDRSPVCTLALSRYLGYAPSLALLRELERIEREAVYQREVFFLENLGFVQPTEARKITFEQSLEFEQVHAEVYAELGYHLINIPPESLEQRVQRVVEILHRLTLTLPL